MRSPSQLVKLLAFVCPPYSLKLSRNEPMAVAFSCFSVLHSRSESKREHEQMGLTVISAFPVAISPLLRCDSSIDSAVWFALSSSSIKLPSDLATLSGAVMAWRPETRFRRLGGNHRRERGQQLQRISRSRWRCGCTAVPSRGE